MTAVEPVAEPIPLRSRRPARPVPADLGGGGTLRPPPVGAEEGAGA